jgi:hypothetical protein
MIRKIVCVLAGLSFTAAVCAADAFTGTWKMDVAKSTFAKGREVSELTSVIVEQGDSAVVTVKGTAADGKPISVKYTVPLKGGPISYTEGGPPAGVSVMSKRVNPTTIDSTSMMNGKEIGSTHVTISADGKTLTLVRKGTDARGMSVGGTEIYHRQ